MRVTLAAPYVDADGKEHAADKTIDLDIAEANRLLYYGLARLPAAADTKKEKA